MILIADWGLRNEKKIKRQYFLDPGKNFI